MTKEQNRITSILVLFGEYMTICVGVKVHDCLVFAADSATSLVGLDEDGKQVISNVFAHGHKVFALLKNRPICAMTSGIGNFGSVSISTLSKDFRKVITSGSAEQKIDPDNYTMEEVAHKAFDFLFNEKFSNLETKPDGTFDYWIGGYSSGSDHSEIWHIQIVNGVCHGATLNADTNSSTIVWSGQTNVLSRLVLGHDPMLKTALLDMGVDAANIKAAMQTITEYTQAPIVNPAMPTQDAIDLADFLVESTKKYVRFVPGANTVGGPTDMATVTKHEGFKWIRRKHYYDPHLNPMETDHV